MQGYLQVKKTYVTYNPEIGREICETISTSTKGIKRLCLENPDWPDRASVYRWCIDHQEFCDQYNKAKARQVEWMVEEALQIAEDGSQDTIVSEDGKERLDYEWVARSRLRVDTIKWFASKLAPKIYGDKVTIAKEELKDDPEIQKSKLIASQLKSDKHGRDNSTES